MLGTGTFIGDMALLAPDKHACRAATVVAMTEVVAYRLRLRSFRKRVPEATLQRMLDVAQAKAKMTTKQVQIEVKKVRAAKAGKEGELGSSDACLADHPFSRNAGPPTRKLNPLTGQPRRHDHHRGRQAGARERAAWPQVACADGALPSHGRWRSCGRALRSPARRPLQLSARMPAHDPAAAVSQSALYHVRPVPCPRLRAWLLTSRFSQDSIAPPDRPHEFAVPGGLRKASGVQCRAVPRERCRQAGGAAAAGHQRPGALSFCVALLRCGCAADSPVCVQDAPLSLSMLRSSMFASSDRSALTRTLVSSVNDAFDRGATTNRARDVLSATMQSHLSAAAAPGALVAGWWCCGHSVLGEAKWLLRQARLQKRP